MNGIHKKPLVFVFPTFLAVGGVERNTVEVIDRLKSHYDFVVVTFDRLRSGQGSLHHQFAACCRAIYDLGEIGSQDEILSYLFTLRDRYKPDLVWICNGSPWLAAHTREVRSVFAASAIVDQQVYDTEVGWVSLYLSRDGGLLAFDRHIAINAKIRDLFVSTVQIPENKVDLIYSVISSDKRRAAMSASHASLQRKFGIDVGKLTFASIGRLTQQKRPLDYVELVAGLVKQGRTDIRFLMVGSGELSGQVDERIVELGLQNWITRMDYVENTFELSRVIDGIVFTSAYEGLPIALLEALSVGTPGISTDTGDIARVFETYRNGAIFTDQGNVGQYVQEFRKFLEGYHGFKTAALDNKEKVAAAFSIETAERKYFECFESARRARNVINC
jgi:glycosyltransferase involved in cell wall biosynthesis